MGKSKENPFVLMPFKKVSIFYFLGMLVLFGSVCMQVAESPIWSAIFQSFCLGSVVTSWVFLYIQNRTNKYIDYLKSQPPHKEK